MFSNPQMRLVALTVFITSQIFARTYYVNGSRLDDSGDGTSWATAKRTIQSAVLLAGDGDVVFVTNGIYSAIATTAHSITVQSINGATFTSIDGGTSNRCATLGPTTNSVLSGFTLFNGFADYGGGVRWGTLYSCVLSNNLATSSGGGASDCNIRDSTLLNNTAYDGGGAWRCALSNCYLRANAATYMPGFGSGGGVASCSLTNCTLYSNKANSSGGGSLNSILFNCKVLSNRSSHWGGGSAGGTLYNCLISGNTALEKGGGSSNSQLHNCLITDNRANTYGGGNLGGKLYNCTITQNYAPLVAGSYASTLNNCILWDNLSTTPVNHDLCTISYSCTKPLPAGSGNISSAPLFIDAASGNYRLQTNSPCIGSGHNGISVGATDLAGNPRILNMTVDMGAYEFNTLTVHFDAQYGSVVPASKTVNYNANYGELPEPTRNGYTFDGWWPEAGGSGVKITETTAVTSTTNHSLYAKWVTNATPNFNKACSMVYSRGEQHTATLLSNGKVLVVGGIDSNNTVLSSAELYDPATGNWTVTASMHTARRYQMATLLPNGKVLVAGGYNGNNAYTCISSSEVYDPTTETWTETGPLNIARCFGTTTLLRNGHVLVTGGKNGSSTLTSSEFYDATTGTWQLTGSLIAARYYHTATLLPNGDVLVAGGSGASAALETVERYNPTTGIWTATDPLRTARLHHTASLLPDGKVLVAGGYTGNYNGYLSEVELYDPSSGTWTTTGQLRTARYLHSATLLPDGRLLLTGGIKNGSLSSCELYDPSSATWAASGSLTTPRNYHTATLLPDGKVLVAGGSGITAQTSAELFDPAVAKIVSTGSLCQGRGYHSATLLPNGKVFVAGGSCSYGALSSAELFDPDAKQWTATDPMLTARSDPTTSLLLNGKVLIVGGADKNGKPCVNVELFDYSSGRYAETGPLTTPRSLHSATVLHSGKVLVVGGDNTGTSSSAELYDLARGTWSSVKSLSCRRKAHTATLLPNGKVLVAGGSGTNTTTELFDPTTETWTTSGSMLQPRTHHTATLLHSGQVLVTGGDDLNGHWLSEAELFDPATGEWAATGNMNAMRLMHTATLLPNGKVLVAGGMTLDNTEQYDPATREWTWVQGSLFYTRYRHTSTLLPNGTVLIAGGFNSDVVNGPLDKSFLFDVGLDFSASSQPLITTFPISMNLGESLLINGDGFRSSSEASGGNVQNSASDVPVLQLRRMDNGQTRFLNASCWSDNSYSSSPVNDLPRGWTLATLFVNGIPSTSRIFNLTTSSRVSFVPGSGHVSIASLYVTYGLAYGELPEADLVGHTFSGWRTELADNHSQVTSGTVVTNVSDHTLYAAWTANEYPVLFEPNGGTVTPASTRVTFGQPYGTLPTPSRTGYTFTGWSASTNGVEIAVTANTVVSIPDAQVLTATWSANTYVLSLDACGGSVNPASMTVTFDSSYGPLPVPTRTAPIRVDYVFAGWFTAPDGTGSPVTEGSPVSAAADHTLYAMWTPSPYLCAPSADAALSTAGRYAGHFYGQTPFAETNLPAILGVFNLSLRHTNGAFTAKAQLQRGSLSFSSKTWSSVQPDNTRHALLTSRTGESLDLFLRQNRVWGTLTGGSLSNAVFALDGARDRFADRHDTDAQARLASRTGYYTLSLPVAAVVATGASETVPQGSGYLALTVGRSGRVRLAGRLPDGTSVSQSAALIPFDGCGPEACTPFFVPLYARQGHASGLLWFSPDPPSAIVTDRDLGWFVRWEKPASAADGAAVLLDAVGGYYNPSTALAGHYLFSAQPNAVPYCYKGGTADVQTVALPTGIGVTLNGARLVMARASRPLLSGGAYDYSPTNSAQASFSLTAATGLFRGTFNLYYDYTSDGRLQHRIVRVPYSGILTPRRSPLFAEEPAGQGYYLVPDNDPRWKTSRLKRPFLITLDALQ